MSQFARPNPSLSRGSVYLSVAVVMALTAAPSFALTHWVNLGNPNALFPYTSILTAAATIQDAVNVSTKGDVINVLQATYAENVTIDAPQRGITLIAVIFNPGFPVGLLFPCSSTITAPTGPIVTIKNCRVGNTMVLGFEITGAMRTEAGKGAGVLIADSSNVGIGACCIESNTTRYGGGVAVLRSDNVTLSDDTIHDNHATAGGGAPGEKGGGVFASRSDALHVQECIITDNTATLGGGGVYAEDSDQLLIEDNQFKTNRATNNATERRFGAYGGAVALFGSSGRTAPAARLVSNTFEHNDATGGGGGRRCGGGRPQSRRCVAGRSSCRPAGEECVQREFRRRGQRRRQV